MKEGTRIAFAQNLPATN